MKKKSQVSDRINYIEQFLLEEAETPLSESYSPNAKKTAEEEDIAYDDNQAWKTIERKQALKQDRQLHKLRKLILPRLFWLSAGWVGFVALVLVVSGLRWDWNKFIISDSVLITLMTATTTTVLGLFAIAANWLFPKK